MSESNKEQSPRRAVRTLAPGETLEQPLRRPLAVLGPRMKVWIASSHLTSVAVHWSGERTEPCVMHKDRSECPFCRRGWRSQAQHWLQVCVEPHACCLPEMLCLTEHAVASDHRLSEPGPSLWLMSLILWREPSCPKGVLFARVNSEDMAAVLPEANDTLEKLHSMWTARLRAARDGDGKRGGRAV